MASEHKLDISNNKNSKLSVEGIESRRFSTVITFYVITNYVKLVIIKQF